MNYDRLIDLLLLLNCTNRDLNIKSLNSGENLNKIFTIFAFNIDLCNILNGIYFETVNLQFIRGTLDV